MVKKSLAMVLTLFMAFAFCISLSSQAFAAEETKAEGITNEEALEIAVEHAGFSESAIRSISYIDTTVDDVAVTKVIFYIGPVEFVYTIDAATGEILSRAIDD